MSRIYSLGARLWESPTMATWASLGARVGGFVFLLPLVLTRIPAEEIALWLLLRTIGGLQLVADMGFAVTFSRVLAYAMGGAQNIREFRSTAPDETRAPPNWPGVSKIVGTMRGVYLGMAIAWLVLLGALGTWSATALIGQMQDPNLGWAAWGVFLLAAALRMHGLQYTSRLLGYDRVAQLRRWETLILGLALLINIVVVLMGGGLLGIVLVTQVSAVANVAVNRWLTIKAEAGRLESTAAVRYDPVTLRAIWPSVWRSGLGVLMSTGLVQGSGVVYARLADAEAVASYLFALTLISYITAFSAAPLYSRLPLLARLRAQNRLREQRACGQRGMALSFWALVIPLVAVGCAAGPTLALLQVNVGFVEPQLWSAMAIAAFTSRYGAMHIQLYSITNDIIWHIANGVTGVLYLLCIYLVFPHVGVLAFPLSQLASDLMFFTWFSASHSYRALELRFPRFEVVTSLGPLLVLVGYVALTAAGQA